MLGCRDLADLPKKHGAIPFQQLHETLTHGCFLEMGKIHTLTPVLDFLLLLIFRGLCSSACSRHVLDGFNLNHFG